MAVPRFLRRPSTGSLGDSLHDGCIEEDITDGGSVSSRSRASEDTQTRRQKRYLAMEVAVAEEKRVMISKRIMIAVILLAAAAMSTLTYFFLSEEEENDFQRQFANYASEIVAVASEHVENSFGSVEAFANSITSAAKETGQTWPNVTLSDYTSKAIRISQLAANARLVTFAPFVSREQRLGFEEYARGIIHHQIQEDLDYLGIEDVPAEEVPGIPEVITYFNLTSRTRVVEPPEANPLLVNWQRYPFEVEPGRVFVMNNMLRVPTIRSAVATTNATYGPTAAFFEAILGVESQVIQPVFDKIVPPHLEGSVEKNIVGVVWLVLNWVNYFQNLLPSEVGEIFVVLKGSCGFSATFLINGLEATNLGLGELHDPKYNSERYTAPFFNFEVEGSSNNAFRFSGQQRSSEVCVDKLTLELYPSDDFKENYTSSQPAIFAAVVAMIFLFTGGVFVLFDWSVQARQSKVEERLTAQDKIVSNLFPGTIRDRLYSNMDGVGISNSDFDESSTGYTAQRIFKGDVEDPEILKTKPIADLYLDATIIFADIAGFTAWSSTREPGHVLRLLETIYGSFDKLAHKHSVFKVETIGDCYVAVTGIPTPDQEHAINMARFARDIMSKMKELTQKLEVSLGPDTTDLSIRIGLHSGQVTAGVLRGERSRFQLFGDTVNTSSRMESTGKKNMIHISAVTAEILKRQDYGQWVVPREDTVFVAGKGNMETFWLETKEATKARQRKEKKQLEQDEESLKVYFEEDELQNADGLNKEQRLIEWMVETMSDLLKQIIAARSTSRPAAVKRAEEEQAEKEGTVLEEAKDIIALPRVGIEELVKRSYADAMQLPPACVEELRRFITVIAHMYPQNAFHNFEHACHVTASVHKLLGRIITMDSTLQTATSSFETVEELVDHSYGITSDPLTHFAVVFSALIHDADHPGVGNAVLVKEQTPLAMRYKNKSVAEQNSFDLSWQLLMTEEYSNLRSSIYCNPAELRRFRQLVVNSVMATDICDKELNALRKERWNRAFSEQSPNEDTRNGKATIVIEHLIQASDVSHTMQHWHIYRKWNEMFFHECMAAYKAGRADQNPVEGWYEGEIGFFDFYIIPLAKKLDSCGVFGVSSYEYLGYAQANRDEWERRGEEIVQEYVANWEELERSMHKPASQDWNEGASSVLRTDDEVESMNDEFDPEFFDENNQQTGDAAT